MKTVLLYTLSISLLIGILAPTIKTVWELDNSNSKQIVVNITEEEEKQETMEILETEFFLFPCYNDLSLTTPKNSLVFGNDIGITSSNSIEVSSPPPKS